MFIFSALLILAVIGLFCMDAASGVLPEKEFQGKVLDGMGAMRTKQDELVKNYDNLQSETKKAFEELTKVKNAMNDQAAVLAALQKVNLQLRNESRMAFGSPMERITRDPEKRLLFGALVRKAVLAAEEKLPGPYEESLKRALTTTDTPGSVGMMTELMKDIYDTLLTYGVWNTFDVRPLSTKTNTLPVKTARPVAVFLPTDATQITDDATKAGSSVTLTAYPIAVLLNVARALIDDSEIDITSDVLGDFAEAFGYRLDWAALQADGTADATDGGNTGVFAGGTAAAAGAGNTTTETTDLDDWIRCLLTVDAAVLQRSARWWMHPQILVRSLSVKDTNKRPIFLTASEAPTAGGIGSILGYPVTLAGAAPSTNAASSKVAVFGDPRGNVIGMRKSWEFEASDHFRWDYYQRSFRGIGRAGTKIRAATAFAVLTLAAQ